MPPSGGHYRSNSFEIVRFGPFELNRDTGELRKLGVRIRLQPRSLQALQALLENPGQILSRAELQSRLWPEDTFVDFESGMNTAINRLRIALGDSAEHPLYVETVARLGYRFIAPLQPLTESTGEAVEGNGIPAAQPKPAQPGRWSRQIIAVGSMVFAIAVALAAGMRFRLPDSPVQFRQVTFRRGLIGGARFLPGSHAIVYVASWENGPRLVYEVNFGHPISRVLGFENFGLASVSSSGDLALLRSGGTSNITGGTLSRIQVNGGPMVQVAQNIFGADWSSDGGRLALVRVVAGAQQLEYPEGRIVYRTSGWLSNVRVSPDGRAVAFIEHHVRHDDAGAICIVDQQGRAATLSDGWASASGLAWRNGNEVWFTAARQNAPRSVWAITTRGTLRPIGQAPGVLTLRDIAPDGRVLLSLDSRRLQMSGARAGETSERDLSLTDWSRVQQLSGDGSLLLFDESGEGAGWRSVAYIRKMDTGEVVQLREGFAQGLDAGTTFAFVLSESRTRIWRVPVSGGSAEEIPSTGLNYQWARPFPDGLRLLALANYPQQPLRLFVQSVRSGRAEPLTGPLMVRNAAASPDGSKVAVLNPEGSLLLYPTAGGPPRRIPANEPLAPIRWSQNGESLFVLHLRANVQSRADVSRLNVSTGRLSHWKTLTPADAIGVNSITGLTIADDEKTYVYSYRRVLSDLHIARGWR